MSELSKAAQLALDAGVPIDDYLKLARDAYIAEGVKRFPNVCVMAEKVGKHRNTLRIWGARIRHYRKRAK